MKSLEYFGCCCNNSLIRDIAEHYSDSLRDMSDTDQYWLLDRVSLHYWMRWCECPPSEEAQEVRDRLEELPKYQLVCLIQAIGDKSNDKSNARPLGYYSCDYEYVLIYDIYETYGDYLENMTEVDQVWLLGMMGDFYYEHHQEEAQSDEAFNASYRVAELDRSNCGALIQALANK